MKKIIQTSLVCALLSTLTPVAEASDSMSLRICEYVQANDKQRLRKYLKQQKLKLRTIYKNLECNSENILVFAAKSKALDIGDYIIGKLPAKKVELEIENIAKHSAHLAAAAKKRIK